jgi:two-component system alkaline phosphatase synthesis response regulator PhoP/two-component system response regulator VicR
MSFRILLIEDEAGLRMALTDLLEGEGYEVHAAADGESGYLKALEGGFDLLVLDVMLPRRNGFEVCSMLRHQGTEMEILMLTARSELSDRVNGLKLGADDYLTKPFEPAELLARVQAMLRRRKKDTVRMTRFSFGDVSVNFDRFELHKAGKTFHLLGKEVQLLQYLVENRGRVVPREELLREVWDYSEDVSSRTLDVHISWLRQKVEKDPHAPDHIHTVRGRGYSFSV